jgi:hypothetical protein
MPVSCRPSDIALSQAANDEPGGVIFGPSAFSEQGSLASSTGTAIAVLALQHNLLSKGGMGERLQFQVYSERFLTRRADGVGQ